MVMRLWIRFFWPTLYTQLACCLDTMEMSSSKVKVKDQGICRFRVAGGKCRYSGRCDLEWGLFWLIMGAVIFFIVGLSYTFCRASYCRLDRYSSSRGLGAGVAYTLVGNIIRTSKLDFVVYYNKLLEYR